MNEPESLVIDPRPNEADKIHDWRLHELLKAGYPLALAERLAARPWHEVDLHRAVELVDAGCSPERAAAILL